MFRTKLFSKNIDARFAFVAVGDQGPWWWFGVLPSSISPVCLVLHQVHDSKTAPRFIKYNLMHVMHQQQDLIQNLERHFVVLNSRMSDLEDKLEHMELGLKMLRTSFLTSEHQDHMRFILIPLTTVSSTCFSTSLADYRWANPEGFPRSPAGFCIIRWDGGRSACRDGPSPSLIQKGWQARAGRDLQSWVISCLTYVDMISIGRFRKNQHTQIALRDVSEEIIIIPSYLMGKNMEKQQ